MRENLRILYLAVILIFVTAACTWGGAGGPMTGGNSTSIAATVISQITRDAMQTVWVQSQASGTPIVMNTPEMGPTGTNSPISSNTPTSTLIPPTATQATPTPTFTFTSSFTPTVTTVPSTRTPTWTVTPLPCNWAFFITDVTIPDGTTLAANTSFTKTWRIKNIGTCTWTSDYAIIFDHGTQFNAPSAQNLGASVAPGQTIDISLNMISPSAAGAYTGYFKLRTSGAVSFGIGSNANTAFWVSINVPSSITATPTATVDPSTPQDFAALRCSASWASSSSPSLSCNGSENFSTGSVSYTTSPVIEIGYTDDEPTLIMIPANGSSGWITGTYPAFNVQSGDHLTGLTGCAGNSPNCSVVFYVNYVEAGNPTVQTLQTWVETYDGNRTTIDIDLSSLAGKTVQFILTVGNSNGSNTDDRAFWEALRIKR